MDVGGGLGGGGVAALVGAGGGGSGGVEGALEGPPLRRPRLEKNPAAALLNGDETLSSSNIACDWRFNDQILPPFGDVAFFFPTGALRGRLELSVGLSWCSICSILS